MTRPEIIRLLFLPREPYPTDRVRINVLFGSEMLGRGHAIDVAMTAAEESVQTGPRDWFGRTVWVGPTDSRGGAFHRLRKHWLALRHDLRALLAARPGRYAGVLISDKLLIAAVAAAVLRRRKLKLIYWLTFPIPEMEADAAARRLARYPLVAWVRGHVGGWLLYKWIMRRSDHVFVQSERMKRTVCEQGVDGHKVSAILTGFSRSEIAPITLRERDSSELRLAYLGTLDVRRHLDVLIDMLRLLRLSGLNARLMLIGGGVQPEDEPRLRDSARAANVLERVESTGFLPQQQALARVAEADICLSPIHRSPILDVGSPTKLIEYLALGMPVVANSHPEQQEILKASRAGVCVPWGARFFAKGVRWLASRSDAERRAMGERGRAWVEANRTYARIADEVERTCLRVLSAGPSGPEAARSDSRTITP